MTGVKNRKTMLIESVITQVAAGDERQRRALRAFFTGSLTKPMSFFKQVERVAKEVVAEAPALEDGVYITSLAGGPGAMVLTTHGLATRRITEKTHRLATKDEVREWRATNVKPEAPAGQE